MTEKFINTSMACQFIARTVGIKVNRVTMYYWMTKGRITPAGDTVKLRHVIKLGRRYTTEIWVNDFLRRL